MDDKCAATGPPLINGLTETNVIVTYEGADADNDPDTPATDYGMNLGTVTVEITNYSFNLAIPFVPKTLTMPNYVTTLTAESAGETPDPISDFRFTNSVLTGLGQGKGQSYKAMKRTLTFIVLSRDAADSRELSRALSAHPGASLLMTSEDAEQVFTETCRLRPSAVVINMNHMGEPALKLVQRIVSDCPSDGGNLRVERLVTRPDSAQHAHRRARLHSPADQR